MLTGIDKNERREYVSKFEKDTKNPTVFVFGPIDNKLRMSIAQSSMDKDGEVDVGAIMARAPEIIKGGLREVRNYQLGGKVHEKITEINDALIESLHATIVTEIAARIIEINFLTLAEEKN